MKWGLKEGISIDADSGPLRYGTFLQQLECGYKFPALIQVWIASAGVLHKYDDYSIISRIFSHIDHREAIWN